MKGVENRYREYLVVSATLFNNCSLKQVVRFNYFFFSDFKGNVGKINYAKIRKTTLIILPLKSVINK